MPQPVLVDTNVILDISTRDERWFDWSSEALAQAGDESTIEDLELALPPRVFTRDAARYRTYFPGLEVIAP